MTNRVHVARAARSERRPSTSADLQARRAERRNADAARTAPADLDTTALEAELHLAWAVAR